ncbi:type II toxin-antitoxin system VapC family toxin [Candidatus Venteria ishoeyi]|uniref:type II toxin-antitoxin system VapC family toxin n=1 Tax=Candidatus Venteria ishoeyi TaxID=1899563 RepID=UPI0025A4D05F|nr:type II toxin-antitoxin system VapC family toxin [Candidatus Venteria ishoeyi]MDM8547586.1 type II toxin-antitoxin system VapC family toxin [Candidatus Venteria ishoeyi]
MYLLDTNIISEQRKQEHANPGVRQFFQQAAKQGARVYISVITIGELRRGIELIRHRGDKAQAEMLEFWLQTILNDYADNILDFTAEESQVWGRLRVPHYENALDKQIAATALIYGLTLVTRNISDFTDTGIQLLNPFSLDIS